MDGYLSIGHIHSEADNGSAQKLVLVRDVSRIPERWVGSPFIKTLILYSNKK